MEQNNNKKEGNQPFIQKKYKYRLCLLRNFCPGINLAPRCQIICRFHGYNNPGHKSTKVSF